MKSIMPFDIKDRCYICKANCHTDTHHIFQGANRQSSDKGLTIQVCRICHEKIHRHPAQFEFLKSKAQEIAMERYGLTIDEWRRLFRKDYRDG